MAYVTGVVLFALAIFFSVCLHEAGHMGTAKAFGMKVTKYFWGFGPTLWSFRKGETEYGLKAIPLGGFVKIVGMTPQEEDVDPADEPRAMWRFPVWKRTVVLVAGSLTHFVLGFVLLWITLAFVGVPNPALAPDKQPAALKIADCVVPSDTQTDCQPNDPKSPAKLAGLQDGDVVTAINGTAIHTYQDLVGAIRTSPPGPATLVYQRNGQTNQVTVNLVATKRHPIDNPDGPEETVSAIGVGWQLPANVPQTITYNPVESVGKATSYTGQAFSGVATSLGKVPAKVPALWKALNGGQRDPNTPMSVVGASRLGGETVQYHAWSVFFLLVASLNFFVGVFNLLPLLPLDGGHIAIAWFERARSWLYARRGKADPGRVDYLKLMPITYAVILIGGAFTLLTVAADIVNPVTLFSK